MPKPSANALETKTVTELRKLASAARIAGYSRMRKADLIAALAPAKAPIRKPATAAKPLTIAQLRAKAKQMNIAIPPKALKADIIRLLEAKPRRLAKRTNAGSRAAAPPKPVAEQPTRPPPPLPGTKAVRLELLRLGWRSYGRSDIHVPCPNAKKPQLEAFLATPRLTDQQLGIFASVSHSLYLYEVGSAKDRRFLSQHELHGTSLQYFYWSDFTSVLATHERVRDLCSVNPYGRPLTLNVERGIWNRLVNGFTMSDDEILAAFARANNTDIANIRQRVMDGVMHTLRQPPGMFRVNTAQLFSDGPFHTTSKEGSWLKSHGIVKCGTKRPWLPIAVGVGYTRMDSHALFLLINRGTGHAYLFESNGFDPDNEGAFRVTHALIALSAIYEHLVSSGNLTPSEWRTTSLVTDMVSGDSIRGQGPQGLQGNRTTLLGHEDQRPYLGHIIGRYSMFIAKRITAKVTIRNAKY
ncbi:Rho termination factor domain containing protein [Acanthamoeba castellanii str. Neff]|uniref:Rho termination factor domain containing protein n=1 Tax=Acanthamoeba castellanii (strain ATCC 30010 / Neff) TaxID=1257118 RepID=L8GZ43_ACACF|nr:Rho termination factor domain containing protein [Acanthamoeba castellanii str. Neff]ELR17803.1 Rho termination factor domain containing protein [Acanthamoeba castellanii str. Neff]